MNADTVEGGSQALRDFKERHSHAQSPEGRLKGSNFKPAKDDVFIATPPKCGTTWVQQIVHGLRSGGDMSFEEICLVVPCVEMAHDYGYTDLNKDQGFLPRAFKTHFHYPHCPKGAGKYIFVTRDPYDANLSLYHFFANWHFKASDIGPDEFITEYTVKRGEPVSPVEHASYWHNLVSWYPHRLDDNVLWLHFEDLKEDLAACVALIANFLNIGANDEALQKLVTKQASFEFMKQHASKFDEHAIKLARNAVMGNDPNAGLGSDNPGKIRSGESGKARDVLSPHTIEAMDRKWCSVVAEQTGCATYKELRAKINEELKSPFGRSEP